MAVLSMADHGGYLAFQADECRAKGRKLHDGYVCAQPFPHVVIDDLLDLDLLRSVAGEFPHRDGKDYFNRAQERLKYQFGPEEWTGPVTRNLFAELNSNAFVGFLEELTGVQNLIVDPAYVGGGLHETCAGGYLGVHADFNRHKGLNVVRKLNLLIYLNDNWEADFGGNLELWDRTMSRCEISVEPKIGRAVIFSTTLDSYHGQPDPLTCPPDRTRRSMALYYYQAATEGLAAHAERTTNFRPRPGSSDRPDWKIRVQHILNDWLPPVVRRRFGNRRFGNRS